ncbi:MAG: hypothetical protein ABL959_22795 [Pyrinomonadaceae bacterium]
MNDIYQYEVNRDLRAQIMNLSVTDRDELIDYLTPREQKAVRMLYGCNEEQRRFEPIDVARHFVLMPDRACEVIAKAERKLAVRFQSYYFPDVIDD